MRISVGPQELWHGSYEFVKTENAVLRCSSLRCHAFKGSARPQWRLGRGRPWGKEVRLLRVLPRCLQPA